MQLSRLHARPIVTVVVVTALLAAASPLLGTLWVNHSAQVFLDHDDAAVQTQQEVEALFGPQRFLVLLQQGAVLDEAGLAGAARLAEALAEVPGVARVVHALEGMPASPPAVERLERDSPLAQVLQLSHAAEGDYAYLILTDAERRPERRATVAGVRDVVDRFSTQGVQSYLAGLDVLDDEMDAAMRNVQRVLIPALVAAMALFLWLLYRDPASVLAVLVCVGAGELAAMEILAAFGEPVNLLTILLPVLQLSLSTALSLHVVTHVRVASQAGASLREAVSDSVRTQWRPCFWTALTTALGFGSLATGAILPLRVLGLATAGSILAAFLLGFTLLPALLLWWTASPAEGLHPGSWLQRYGPRLLRHRWAWWLGAALLLGGGVAAGPLLRLETNGLHYYSEEHPLRIATERIESRVTGTTGLEVVGYLDGHADPAIATGILHDALSTVPGTRGVLSLKVLAEQEFFRAALRGEPGPPKGALAQAAEPFQVEGRIRAMVLVDTMSTEEFRPIRKALDHVVEELQATDTFHQVRISGDFPIIMRVQDELVGTLIRSLGITFASILLLIFLIHRRLSWLIALGPTLSLPLAGVAILCLLADVPLTIGTVMVFSVTLGIAVDDAIHVLHSLSQDQSFTDMLGQVGEALFATSVVIAAGFLVLTASPFLPTSQFGLVTAIAMLVALVANLLLLPGILLRDERDGALPPARMRLRKPAGECVADRSPPD